MLNIAHLRPLDLDFENVLTECPRSLAGVFISGAHANPHRRMCLPKLDRKICKGQQRIDNLSVDICELIVIKA